MCVEEGGGGGGWGCWPLSDTMYLMVRSTFAKKGGTKPELTITNIIPTMTL